MKRILIAGLLLLQMARSGLAVSCQVPQPPDDGSIVGTPTIQTPRGLAYSVGDTIKFTCNPGFGLAGADTAICMGDGQFSEDPPFCAAITCDRPRIDNGVIIANAIPGTQPPPPNTFPAGTSINVRCSSGFTLVPADSRVSTCQ